MQRINNMEELKTLAKDTTLECFIHLQGGLRSSKTITYYGDDKWWLYNNIDDTEEELTTEQLASETNIVKAMDNMALYKY